MKFSIGTVLTLIALIISLVWWEAGAYAEDKKRDKVLDRLVQQVDRWSVRAEIEIKIAELEAKIDFHKAKYGNNPDGVAKDWLDTLEGDLAHELQRREKHKNGIDN